MKSPGLMRRLRRAALALRSDERITRDVIAEVDRMRPLVAALTIRATDEVDDRD